ncbi:hypothetical protein B0J12DRAFT_680487, partial [Macrophomina phaseolina]
NAVCGRVLFFFFFFGFWCSADGGKYKPLAKGLYGEKYLVDIWMIYDMVSGIVDGNAMGTAMRISSRKPIQ